MESCLFEGVLTHRRFAEPKSSFRYPLFMVYLDLGELDRVFEGRWLWSAHRPNVAWFRRGDHFGDPGTPLDVAAKDLVAERTGRRPGGPVRLLTHLRYFLYGFNPVSFFYCFAADGRTLEAVVAEVRNTPWGERYLYVLAGGELGRGPASRHDAAHPKAFHVSPFLGMDLGYAWSLTTPPSRDGARLSVDVELARRGARVFRAGLRMRRRAIDATNLRRCLLTHPFMTLEVIAGIYGQALRLVARGAPFFPHPHAARGT